MKIENEHTLKSALINGVNLFLGAGFSVLAKDSSNKQLPVGGQLAQELAVTFNCPQMDLPQMATILEASKSKEFKEYLNNRFRVCSEDTLYTNINAINIKSIYTTNIDNLIPRIIKKSTNKFLNDQRSEGMSTDKNAINYLTLHGNVDNNDDKFVFSSSSIATIYNNDTRIWNYLSLAIETSPTIFIGYSLNDNATFNSLFSRHTFKNAQKDKWIILLESDNKYESYYKSLGFKIIYGDTKSFLQWISTIDEKPKQKKAINLSEVFPRNIVPRSKFDKDGVIRPIEEFFRGASPIWNDILSGQIHKTSYSDEIINSIYNTSKNTIIIGAPATGKTTLMMQVAYNVSFNGEKLIFDNLSDTKADYIIKIINGEKALVFIENFTDNVDAFNKLSKHSNIKLVGIDRSHYFNSISHLLTENKFEIINITDITELDLQGVYNSLPTELKSTTLKREVRSRYSSDTLFEFVKRNIKQSNIGERYREVLDELIENDPLLAEFIILCSYAHASRIPVSSEMAIAYFKNDCNYKEVFEMRDSIFDMIKDYDDYFREKQEELEYYYPRSYYIAESVLEKCPRDILKTVLTKFIDNISQIQITNYRTFKRHGFDKNIINKAFSEVNEGSIFYEKAFLFDYHNPFVLQQGALYLSGRKNYKEAFRWIDRALNMTSDKYFSIRNSHAIILFDANISSPDKAAKVELDRSMNILEKCFNDDKRTTFHAVQYGRQAMEYYTLYQDEKSKIYLDNAKRWLTKESNDNNWNRDVKNVLADINERLNNL